MINFSTALNQTQVIPEYVEPSEHTHAKTLKPKLTAIITAIFTDQL